MVLYFRLAILLSLVMLHILILRCILHTGYLSISVMTTCDEAPRVRGSLVNCNHAGVGDASLLTEGSVHTDIINTASFTELLKEFGSIS